jgi:uncharacterized membrane protein YhaH (DUF805 family)
MAWILKGNNRLASLFFSHEGRLNRKPFNIIVVSIALILPPIFVLFPYFYVWMGAKAFALAITLCPAIQRFHDRGYSSWWYVYSLIALVSIYLVIFSSSSIVYERLLHEGDSAYDYLSTWFLSGLANLGRILYIAMVGWLVIQLCFLRGLEGDNEFGADPLKNVTPNFRRIKAFFTT